MWKEGDPLPYDGYYNGNAEMMIANGTYADFRPRVVLKVQRGFYSSLGDMPGRIRDGEAKLALWDKKWSDIPVQERLRLRNRVADDTEYKEEIVYTSKGPMRTYKAKPSCNNNLDKRDRMKALTKKKMQQKGAIQKSEDFSVVGLPQVAVSA